MNPIRPRQDGFLRGVPSRVFRTVWLLAFASLFSVSAWAQNNADDGGRRQRGPGGDGGGRGNFDPAQMQERMLRYIREQFAVTDDSEWALIAERINKVLELRRNAPGGGGFGMMFGGRGGPGGGGGDRGGGDTGGRGRGGRGGMASPEQDALRTALVDKLPDAEIKARLARLREVRAQAAGKLEKAQEDLRAVLTLRQEAMAVMAGLLP